jgi:quercetin dioxygenase-like cupin family protein
MCATTDKGGQVRRHRRATWLLALGFAFPILVGAALATPVVVNSKSGVHLKTKGSADLVTQQIVLAGGGTTGWHSHPGPVLVTIKRGAVRVIYADDASCQGTVYEAGDSFVDRGDEVVHIARNVSATDEVEFWATYIVPGVPAGPFRLDEPVAPIAC